MTLEATREVIISRFQTLFDDANPTVPVKYPNQAFEQPDTAWASIMILGGGSVQANLGIENITERYIGIVQIDIMVPEDDGTKEQQQLADAAGKVFSRKELQAGTSALTFKTPDPIPAGNELGFDKMIIRVPFRRDEKV